MGTCGLSKGEADLVMQFNKQNMPHSSVPVPAPAQRLTETAERLRTPRCGQVAKPFEEHRLYSLALDRKEIVGRAVY